MKLLMRLIDWEYPEQRGTLAQEVWDLSNRQTVMDLHMAFANGIVLEMDAEADTDERLNVLRGLIRSAGSCVPVILSTEEKENLWLYRAGYECYRQGSKDPAYIFVDPVPQPSKFELLSS